MAVDGGSPRICSGAAYSGVNAASSMRVARRIDVRSSLGGDQFGDAEVEQFRFSVLGDQDIRRLDVSMDDDIAVCMRQRAQHIEDQPDAGRDIERVLDA